MFKLSLIFGDVWITFGFLLFIASVPSLIIVVRKFYKDMTNKEFGKDVKWNGEHKNKKNS